MEGAGNGDSDGREEEAYGARGDAGDDAGGRRGIRRGYHPVPGRVPGERPLPATDELRGVSRALRRRGCLRAGGDVGDGEQGDRRRRRASYVSGVYPTRPRERRKADQWKEQADTRRGEYGD